MEKNDRELIRRLYKKLYLIRKTEEEIARVYPTDKIKSPIHLSIGQESVSVGVCDNLKKDDVVFGTYRGHAMYLAKGGDLNKLIAELYGKETGCCKGRGGSMHIIDKEAGVMGTSAIVGTTIPIAVGYAQALKLQGSNSIVVVFFGDGAMDEGVVHESMNYAGVKKLPILFVLEDNQYAIFNHTYYRQFFESVRMADNHVWAAEQISHDIFEVYHKAKALIEYVRKSCTPAFLQVDTFRLKEHVGPEDYDYPDIKDRDEFKRILKNDQVKFIRRKVKNPKEIESIIDKKIKKAFKFAEKSEEPDWRDLERFSYE